MCRQFFKKWHDALVKPKDAFKREKKGASLSEALKHIALGGFIAGAISVLLAVGNFGLLILMPISAILGLIISSGIFYLFARLFKGKGEYGTQTYLFSLYQAPLLPIASIASVVPVLGGAANIAINIYSLYLATLALKETHKYSTGRAVATWLVPAILIAALFVILVSAFQFLYAAGTYTAISPIAP